MKHIQAPEQGDPAVLVDGTEGTITFEDSPNPPNFWTEFDDQHKVNGGSWELSLETPDGQRFHERNFRWDPDRWQEV